MIPVDEQTRDLRRSCLKLAGDVVFAPEKRRDQTIYKIESQATGRFFQIDYRSYVFVSLLDGQTTFSSALAESARALTRDALSESEAVELVTWMTENQLVADEAKKQAARSRVEAAKNSWNPLWTKISFGDPTRLLDAVMPSIGMLAHPLSGIAISGLVFTAALTLLANWERFTETAVGVLVPGNWWLMILVWGGLKIVHEAAHAVTCRYFGGEVRQTGLIFVLMAPMAYVDVTSSWKFRSRWQRIAVAAAGVASEILIASIAVLLWSQTDSVAVAQLCQSVVIAATVGTVLFNLNPLMRFDGYFIVSDLLGLPNLYGRGSKCVGQDMNWLFFGQLQRHQSKELAVVRTYGYAAAVWKVVVCGTMLIGASVLMAGAGVVIAGIGIALWCGVPAVKAAVKLVQAFAVQRTAFYRAVGVTVMLSVISYTTLTLAPNPFVLRAPCVVDYHQAAFVRAESDGFIAEVCVADGEYVHQGQLLVRIENPELQSGIDFLQAELQQSVQRRRQAQNAHNVTATQTEFEKQLAIRRKLEDRTVELESLAVTAPHDGWVVARGLRSRVGTRVKKGQQVLLLGNEQQKEMIVSIANDEITQVLAGMGKGVTVHLNSGETLLGRLTEVRPRASRRLPHPALAASLGGPLAVRPVAEAADTPRSDVAEFEFPEARFEAFIRFSEQDAAAATRAGQSGWVTFARRSDSILQTLSGSFRCFVARTIANVSG